MYTVKLAFTEVDRMTRRWDIVIRNFRNERSVGQSSILTLISYTHLRYVRREKKTKSQAVARIADRTASQHLCGSRDVIGFTRDYFIAHMPFRIVVLWNESLTVSEIFNVECNAMVNMTLIRSLNKGQGRSFWYQSISHIRLPIGCQ